MKRFVGISSILLLSSILANTGTSLVLAEETKEAKVVDTTTSKKEKNSTSKEENSDETNRNEKEKKARDVEEPTPQTSTSESSAIEEVNGTPQLQDPTKDLMDKITDSTKDNKDSKEEASKEDKEDKNSKERLLKSTLNGVVPRMGLNLRDWDYSYSNDGTKLILNKYKGHGGIVNIYPTYSTYWQTYDVCIEMNALRGNSNITEVNFIKEYGNDGTLIWNTSRDYISADANYFLADMKKLKNVDFSGLNTKHIQEYSHMFSNDISLTNVKGLEHLKIPNAYNFSYMFSGCTGLRNIDLSNMNIPDNTTNYYTSFEGMFQGCTNLYAVKMINLPKNANMKNMFNNCTIIYADLQFRDPSYLASDVSGIFYVPEKIGEKVIDGLPILIYSNSESFLTNKLTGDKRYYSYDKFTYNGRWLPCIITSGEGGMFDNITNIGGKPYYIDSSTRKKYPIKFDVINDTYEDKDHWHNAKISMVNTTNGYATDHDPIPSLKGADSEMASLEKKITSISSFTKFKSSILY